MSEFFAMGNYGVYVWLCYGITLLGLVLLFIWSWFGAKSRDAELEKVRQWARAERKTPSSAALSTVPLPDEKAKSDTGMDASTPVMGADSGRV